MQRSIYFEDSVDFKKPVCVCVGDEFVQFSPGSLRCRHETFTILDIYEASPSHSDGFTFLGNSNRSYCIFRDITFCCSIICGYFDLYTHDFRVASKYDVNILFCVHVKVVFKHNRAARSLAKQLRFNHRVFVKTQEKSAIIMIVIGLFLVCYGLYFHCSFLLVFKRRRECYDIEYKILVLMLNSAVNPLAYSFLKRDIKKEIKGLLCCSSVTESSSVHPLHQSNFPLAAVRN